MIIYGEQQGSSIDSQAGRQLERHNEAVTPHPINGWELKEMETAAAGNRIGNRNEWLGKGVAEAASNFCNPAI